MAPPLSASSWVWPMGSFGRISDSRRRRRGGIFPSPLKAPFGWAVGSRFYSGVPPKLAMDLLDSLLP